jgi:hypothetical protein
MWWQAVDDIAANLFAWLISDKGGDVIGVAVLLVIGVATLIRWHRRQRAAKKLGMASFYFIVPCFVVALIAIAAAAYGIGLRGMMIPPIAAAVSEQTAMDLYTGKQVAVPNPYRPLSITAGPF